MKAKLPSIRTLTVLLFTAVTGSVYAQGDIPSGALAVSGSGPYTYDVSFTDSLSSTAALGSIWYAWEPGFFYLPSAPTSVFAPAGWTATIFGNSIQFSANGAGNAVQPGETLSGFNYTANFTPAQLNAAPNSGKSVGYVGGIQSDPGVTFVFQPVPEPSTFAFLGVGAIALAAKVRRRSKAG